MAKSVRSVAIELHENANAIEAWRATLPEKQRKRLIHPLSNVRRWRASLSHGTGKCPADLKRDAMAAWRRFVSCVRLLPADQAAPLWQVVQTGSAKSRRSKGGFLPDTITKVIEPARATYTGGYSPKTSFVGLQRVQNSLQLK